MLDIVTFCSNHFFRPLEKKIVAKVSWTNFLAIAWKHMEVSVLKSLLFQANFI